MKIAVLGSGSKGNAIFLRLGKKSILIDAGLSFKEIVKRTEKINETLSGLCAILISHEHQDHIKGLELLSSRLGVPAFASPGTISWLKNNNFKAYGLERLETGKKIKLEEFSILSFPIPHDAKEPIGFIIETSLCSVGIALDLGKVTGLVKERLKHTIVTILESNYEPELLMNGPYSWALKQRIKSSVGHLSNQEAGELLGELEKYGLKKAILAHLSETNNKPQLAYKRTKERVNELKIYLSLQDKCSEVLELGG